MARQFLVPLNLNKNELQNARVQNLSSAPANPVSGQIYFDTSTSTMYFWNGTAWIPTSGSTEVIQDTIGASVSGGTGLTATYVDETGVTTIDLDNTAVTPGTYGSASEYVTIQIDAQGRITSASEGNIQITTSQVTDLEEYIEDVVATASTGLIRDGEGIDVTYDDTAGTLTIAGEDATSTNKGIASFDVTDFTVTSGAVTVNVERIEDIVANLVVGGTGITDTYVDGDGTLTIAIDSTVTTNDGVQTLTNKTLGATTALGADLNAATYKITGLGAPTNANDAATKAYVDSVAEGLHIHASVKALAASDLDLSGPIANTTNFDGVTLVVSDRVLLIGQNPLSENGIYVVATEEDGFVTLVRAQDYNSANEIQAGDFVFVSGGVTYNSTGWVQENPVNTLGTDPIVWDQFSGAGTYTAGAGLTLTGNTFSVDVTPTSGSASLTNTGGAVEVKVNTNAGLETTASGVGINVGTGLTFATGALTFASSYGVRKLAYNVGNGSALTYTLNHNLGSRDITVSVYENASPFAQVEVDVEHTDSNNILVGFAAAPTTDQYRVVIVG
jgi:hypothetical protein